mmetsp:Transcript_23737/g.29205  ORF Transcript_23737/g.29205 Transcript_23737/m.29205 type:complete len:139 (-) Transcript_23737:84-500(-)
MMLFFIAILACLIQQGKKREKKRWEARNCPTSGDLVTYEGMNLMLESSTLNAQKIIEAQDQAKQKENLSIKNVVEKPKSKKEINTRHGLLDSFLSDNDSPSSDRTSLVSSNTRPLPNLEKIQVGEETSYVYVSSKKIE